MKGTLGAAALTSGLIYPRGVSSSPWKPAISKLIPGLNDNDTIKKAKNNIPKIRMRDAEIMLLDMQGQPLVDREVTIEQLSHQFLFGDNNWEMATMYRNGVINNDRAKYYRKLFADVLNSLNTTVYWTERPRNDGTKTEDFQGDLRLDDFNESVDWANANGLTAKGHPLFWAVPKAIPEWAQRYDWETLKKFIEVRVRDLCARYKGRVQIWDAVNEMLWEAAPKNLSLRQWPHTESMQNMTEYISLVLKWARAEDPDALYCINDYGLGYSERKNMVDQNGNPVNAAIQRKRLMELTKRLGDAGFPPNLLGDQSRPAWLMPSAQAALYDELSETGIPLSITEFWANRSDLRGAEGKLIIESEEWRTLGINKEKTGYSDDELQEIRDQFVINFMTCAFGHPAVHSFFFWGFINDSVMFSDPVLSNHTLNPVYNKVRDLIHNEWKTRLTARTDNYGKVRFRGFCGNYSARVRKNPEDASEIGMKFLIDRNSEMNKYVIKTVL